MAEEEVRKLVLPYDHTQLPALLASIKNETELRTFVLEYAEAKGTSLTENQVNTLIATYITENNIGSGNSQSGTGLTPEQAQKLAMILTSGDGTKYLGDDGAYHNVPSGSGNAGTSIDDTTTTSASTWSSSKIHQEIENKTVSQSQINSAVNSYLAENPVTGVVNSLSDMNIVLLGDSITDTDRYATLNGRGRWVEPFKKLANPKSLKNYAVDGCTWSFWSTTVETTEVHTGWNKDNVIWNQVNRLKADVTAETVPTPDLIMIMAGANDSFNASGSISNGTPSEVFSTATQSSTLSELANISASIRKTCDDLRTAYPSAKIVLITPFVCGNFTEYTRLIAIRRIIEECAMYLGLYTIDGSKAGFVWHEEQNEPTNLISDHTHLTLLGGRRAGKMIYDELCAMPFVYTETQFNKTIDNTLVALESLQIVGPDEVAGGGSWTTYSYNVNPIYANDLDLEWVTSFPSGGNGRMNGNVLIFYGGDYVDLTLRDKNSGISTTKRIYKAEEQTGTTYTVTNNLTHVTNSYNSATATENQAYNATLTADSGYTIDSVTVTMGGTDITSTAYSNGTISIASVTGNIVITAVASIITYTVTKTGTNCTITGGDTATYGSTYTATIEADSGYTLQTPTITMGGNTLSGVYSNGTVTISNVTGNIAITASAIETSQEVHATAISLSPSTVSFSTAGDTSTITPTLTPVNTTDTVTSWVSSDTNVATVANGVITSVADGTATITATTSNGLTATVSVTVTINNVSSTSWATGQSYPSFATANNDITIGSNGNITTNRSDGVYMIIPSSTNMKNESIEVTFICKNSSAVGATGASEIGVMLNNGDGTGVYGCVNNGSAGWNTSNTNWASIDFTQNQTVKLAGAKAYINGTQLSKSSSGDWMSAGYAIKFNSNFEISDIVYTPAS